jgi:hypothetical protein
MNLKRHKILKYLTEISDVSRAKIREINTSDSMNKMEEVKGLTSRISSKQLHKKFNIKKSKSRILLDVLCENSEIQCNDYLNGEVRINHDGESAYHHRKYVRLFWKTFGEKALTGVQIFVPTVAMLIALTSLYFGREDRLYQQKEIEEIKNNLQEVRAQGFHRENFLYDLSKSPDTLNAHP